MTHAERRALIKRLWERRFELFACIEDEYSSQDAASGDEEIAVKYETDD